MIAPAKKTGAVEKMGDIECLTEKNWHVYAARAYAGSPCAASEFFSDMMHFKYVKKLVTQYVQTSKLKERLILNHIILLRNVLGPEALARILFLKMPEHMRVIAPFLVMIDAMPAYVRNVGAPGVAYTDRISFDQRVVSILRALKK